MSESLNEEIKRGLLEEGEHVQSPYAGTTERIMSMKDEELKKYLIEEEEKASRFLKFERAKPEWVDYYRNLKFPELMEEYLFRFCIVRVIQCFSVRDVQLLILMHREVFVFRSESEQKELEERIKKIERDGLVDNHGNIYKCREED